MDKMVIMNQVFDGFFKNKKVLITGHTGFKGSWLCLLLNELGADVYGYALPPKTTPNLFSVAQINKIITSYVGDIRDFEKLQGVLHIVQPDIIIHMAAQALVLESYKNPRENFAINIMGTVNLLDAARTTKSVKAIINVTTDKCYENKEWHWGYRENEQLGGYDPYSNSKACSELVTASFRNSFFNLKEYDKHGVAIATARAGNVIGGGDWANDRLIPDFIKAINKGESIIIRSPYAIRPWQHVLEPLAGYLILAKNLFENGVEFADAWNFGPEDTDAKNVQFIIEKICKLWGHGASSEIDNKSQLHEAHYLKLDCSKAKAKLNWFPKWNIERALISIVEWNKAFINKDNMFDVTNQQIADYFKENKL
jgi:CDP-glucose 4,6-dehydratase